MKTVSDACKLQPNALSIQLSDQVEQLDELITAQGQGEDFFEKTYITQGMQDLISEGLSRLAGASSQAIFHLKQAMGGGKTHLLVGFGLLSKYPKLRKTYCTDLPQSSAFETANVAAFNGRNTPEQFFWGEIANQLGKGDQFKSFWTGGPKAPDEKDWLTLFGGDKPLLILLDEMPPYFHYLDTQPVGMGTVADIATRAFANMLTAAGFHVTFQLYEWSRGPKKRLLHRSGAKVSLSRLRLVKPGRQASMLTLPCVATPLCWNYI